MDMTAFARFCMASRSMRDATNLAGSQGYSARRIYNNLNCRSYCTSTLHTLDPFAYHGVPFFSLPCIYSCHRLFLCSALPQPANPALSTCIPQSEPSIIQVHWFMHVCDFAPKADPQTSNLEPASTSTI